MDGVANHEIGRVRNTADHIEGDHEHAVALPDLSDGGGDFSSHQASSEDEDLRAGKASGRPNGVREAGFANEGDGIHANALAADVVSVGFADGSENDLGDLSATPDDDNALAEDGGERRVGLHFRHIGNGPDGFDEGIDFGRAGDIELEIDLRTSRETDFLDVGARVGDAGGDVTKETRPVPCHHS